MTVEQAAVQRGLHTIKTAMPNVYAAVQAKAAQIGQGAYGLVRRGLRGETNCFYAFEAGQVVGTPFIDCDVNSDIALLMVQFGAAHVCVWGQPPAVGQGASHGTA